MTWQELKDQLNLLTPEQLTKEAVIFDYAADAFAEVYTCWEGDPSFHITIR